MRKSLAVGWVALGVLVWGLSGPAFGTQAAGQDPMELLPASTLGFARINNLDKALGQLEAMVKPLGAGLGAMGTTKVRSMLGLAFMSQGLKALDTTDVLIIAMVDPGPRKVAGKRRAQPGEPDVVLVAKTTDLEALKASIAEGAKNLTTKQSKYGYMILKGQVEEFDFDAIKQAEEDPDVQSKVGKKLVMRRWLFLQKGGYVLYSKNVWAMRAVTRAHKSLAGTLNAEDKKLLSTCQMGAYIDLGALVKKYRAPLEQAKMVATMAVGMLSMGAAQGQDAEPGPAAAQKAMLAKVLPEVIDGLFQFVFDARSFCAVASVGPPGATLTTIVRVADGSRSAQSLALHKPGAIKSLGCLDTGSSMYFGMAMDMKRIIDWFVRLTDEKGLGEAVGMSPEQIEQFRKTMEAYASAELIDVGEAISFGREGAPGGGVAVMAFKNVKPLQGRVMMKDWAALMAVKGIEVDKDIKTETYKNVKIETCRAKVDLDAMAQLPQAGPLAEAQKAILTGIMGGDTLVMRQAIVKNQMIFAWGADPKRMRQAIDATLAGGGALGRSKGYRKIRAALPGTTNVLMLADVPRLLQSVASTMSKTGMALPMVAQGGGPLGPPSFMAMSVRLGGPAIRLDIVVPSEQMLGVRDLMMPKPAAKPIQR